MGYKSKCITILCFLLVVASPAIASDEELPDVAFLPVMDATNKKSYEWIRRSLRDAVFQRFLKKFEFRGPDRSLTDRSASKSFRFVQDMTDENILGSYCEQENLDYLVYASYVSDGKYVIIYSGLYNHSRKQVLIKERIKLEPQSDMFKGIHELADRFVASMVVLAEQQESDDEDDRLILKQEKPEPATGPTASAAKHQVYYEAYGLGLFGGLGYQYTVSNTYLFTGSLIYLPDGLGSNRDHFGMTLGAGYNLGKVSSQLGNLSARLGGVFYSHGSDSAPGAYIGAAYDFYYRQFVIRPAVYAIGTTETIFPYGGLSLGYQF